MIERIVFPPDMQSFFDLELEGDAKLINRAKTIPGAWCSATLRNLQVYTNVCIPILSVMRC